MIFLDPLINDSDDVYSLGPYYPSKDPQFSKDSFSKTVLKIKYRHDSDKDPQAWKLRNKTLAIREVLRRIDPLVSKNIAIAVVPSHDKAGSVSGIHQLAKALAGNGRIDATECLVRHKKIRKLALGGSRSVETHLNSIRVEGADAIQGREVLLLDDVATSGNSLEACRQLLLAAGAERVKCMVLGRTTHSI
jgi:predicted amidophosphoribosyltransferase